MKIFKRIYYPVMAALFVLMLVLGIVDARVATSGGKLSSSRIDTAVGMATAVATVESDSSQTHNSYESLRQQSVRDYILRTLTEEAVGAERVYSTDTDDDGRDLVDYFTDYDGNEKPSVYLQRTVVTQQAQGGESEVAVNREVQNIILSVPGTSNDAILLHARYDSSAVGGASDATAVGALLQIAADTVKAANNGKTYKNTIVFLFGDAGQEGDLGACVFVNQFAGFHNVAEHVRAAADYAVEGTGGTLMMYGQKSGSLHLIGKYAGFNGSTYASSALELLVRRSDYASSGAFGDYNTLHFTNRGGFNRYATANDTRVNRKLVSQQANAMNKFVNCYANASVAGMDSKSSAVYFSYLDVMTVYYPAVVSFVIGGILLGLLIAIIILNVRNKAFSWGKALAGVAVQLVTLLATSLAALALFYLFALLLSGFGVIPFHSLSSVRFAGTGTLLSAGALAVVLAIFFYIIFKRAFGVKAPDVVRGNVLLFAAVAVILAFAVPSISYPFTCVALFALVALLMTVLFKKKFNDKFRTASGMNMELLFLYVWPIIFALPLFMPLFFVAQTLFPAVSIVVVLALMVALLGFITPYADYFKPIIDKAFKKLPQRTVRYERMVTERVEDRAKKGKFTEVTAKKIVAEKEPWVYRNRIGLSFVAIVTAFMVIMFSSFSTTYSSTAIGGPEYANSIYDDSLLLVYEKNESAAATTSVEVHDQAAYNYIRYAVNDMSWSNEKNAYVKEYTADINTVIPTVPDFSKSGDAVYFTVFDSAYSQITVTLRNASAVTSVIFNEGDDNRESEEYEFSKQDEIVFRLPYGYDDFSMTVDASCEITFEQHVYNANNLQGIEGSDWYRLYDYYTSNNEVGPALRSGIVIRLTKEL